jgi:hypothetical protein
MAFTLFPQRLQESTDNTNLLSVDPSTPINWDHPLNKNRALWFLGLPNNSGGSVLVDVINPKNHSIHVVGGPGAWVGNPYTGEAGIISNLAGATYAAGPTGQTTKTIYPMSLAITTFIGVLPQPGNSNTVIFGDGNDGSQGWGIGFNGGTSILVGYALGVGAASSGYTFPKVGYYRIGVSIAAAGVWSFYVNGVFVGSATQTFSTGTSQSLSLGGDWNSTGITNNYIGASFSATIWAGRVLSAADWSQDNDLSWKGWPGVLNRHVYRIVGVTSPPPPPPPTTAPGLGVCYAQAVPVGVMASQGAMTGIGVAESVAIGVQGSSSSQTGIGYFEAVAVAIQSSTSAQIGVIYSAAVPIGSQAATAAQVGVIYSESVPIALQASNSSQTGVTYSESVPIAIGAATAAQVGVIYSSAVPIAIGSAQALGSGTGICYVQAIPIGIGATQSSQVGVAYAEAAPVGVQASNATQLGVTYFSALPIAIGAATSSGTGTGVCYVQSIPIAIGTILVPPPPPITSGGRRFTSVGIPSESFTSLGRGGAGFASDGRGGAEFESGGRGGAGFANGGREGADFEGAGDAGTDTDE